MAIPIERQEQISQLFYEKYRGIEKEYLDLIAKQIKDIGQLNTFDVSVTDQLVIMNGNINEVTKKLALETKKSVKEVEKILSSVADEQYKSVSRYYTAAGVKQVSIEDNKAVQKIIKAIAKQTQSTMVNLSNTTVMTKFYKEAIDEAVIAVSSGVTDYNTAMRKVIRQKASEGVRTVEYKTKRTRRLDSAVRMNVMDGMHQINMGVAEQTGKEFGADGVEISSHSNPAPDHKYIDGKTMTQEEFDRFQKTAERPIGQYNCYHFAVPVILDVSKSNLTDSQRKRKRDKEDIEILFDGHKKTRYEWTQEQRKIETAIRYQRDIQRMANITGDDDLKNIATLKIKNMTQKYKELCRNVKLENDISRSY